MRHLITNINSACFLSKSHWGIIALRKASVWASLCLLHFRPTVKEVYRINTAFRLWAPEAGDPDMTHSGKQWPHPSDFHVKDSHSWAKGVSFVTPVACPFVKWFVGLVRKPVDRQGVGPHTMSDKHSSYISRYYLYFYYKAVAKGRPMCPLASGGPQTSSLFMVSLTALLSWNPELPGVPTGLIAAGV